MLGANRLGGVFDHHKLVFLRDPHYGVHIGHLAVKVDRDDGARVRGYLRLDLRRVEVVTGRVDVHEDRLGADARNRARGGKKGVGRGDHLVARANPLRHQANQQRIRSRRDPNPVSAA